MERSHLKFSGCLVDYRSAGSIFIFSGKSSERGPEVCLFLFVREGEKPSNDYQILPVAFRVQGIKRGSDGIHSYMHPGTFAPGP